MIRASQDVDILAILDLWGYRSRRFDQTSFFRPGTRPRTKLLVWDGIQESQDGQGEFWNPGNRGRRQPAEAWSWSWPSTNKMVNHNTMNIEIRWFRIAQRVEVWQRLDLIFIFDFFVCQYLASPSIECNVGFVLHDTSLSCPRSIISGVFQYCFRCISVLFQVAVLRYRWSPIAGWARKSGNGLR